MGQHRMLSKDVAARTGVCSECGPVDILRKSGKAGGWRCGVARRRHKATPGRARKEQKRPHGLTATQAREVREGKACEMCGGTDGLSLDHCHSSKLRRGVLCRCHNTGLGCFHDSVAELEAAIAYLRRYRKEEGPTPVV